MKRSKASGGKASRSGATVAGHCKRSVVLRRRHDDPHRVKRWRKITKSVMPELVGFHSGKPTRILIGQNAAHHETNPRSFFLDALNEHAPEVLKDLKSSVLPVMKKCLGDDHVLSLGWIELRAAGLTALATALEQWARRWGLEPERWNTAPTWAVDAALRLLLRWHECPSAVAELTPAYSIYRGTRMEACTLAEVRSMSGFEFLVMGHVLQYRPWFNRELTPDAAEAICEKHGDRLAALIEVMDATSIARAIRTTAELIGLKKPRAAKRGRKRHTQ